MIHQQQFKCSIEPSYYERYAKSPDIISVKSDKVLRHFNKQLQNNRPFRRKQDKSIVCRKKNSDDTGKLASCISMNNSPDTKMIAAQLQAMNKQQFKKNQLLNRKFKNAFNIQQDSQYYKINSMKEINSFQNMQSIGKQVSQQDEKEIVKIIKKQNNELKMQIQNLQNQNKDLQTKYKQILKKYKDIQQQIQQKENTITELNSQANKIIQQCQQQKQVNKCLQQIIEKLNIKIQTMLQQQSQFSFVKLQDNQLQQNKQSIQQQVKTLRQNIYTLKKQLQSMDVQYVIMTKLRYELEQERKLKRTLQLENKGLKQRIVAIKKLKQNNPVGKNGKISLRKQLQYSISFSFDN